MTKKKIYKQLGRLLPVTYLFILLYFIFIDSWSNFNLEIFFTSYAIIYIFIVGVKDDFKLEINNDFIKKDEFEKDNNIKSKILLEKKQTDSEDLNLLVFFFDLCYAFTLISANFGYFEEIDGLMLFVSYIVIKSGLKK